MASKNRFQKSVDPRVAAVLILATLAAVQYLWWQGLVARPKPVPGGGMSGGGGAGPSEIVLMGDPAAKVQVVAGGPEPGDADGPGWAARFDGPAGIAVTQAGGLAIADSRNSRVRLMDASGKTTTLAGSRSGYQDGDARSALFNGPTGVAAGADGSVYVADTLNHRIRRILNGQVQTIAGGAPGFADGPGPLSRFRLPTGLIVVPAGPGKAEALLVADTGNGRIRMLKMQGDAATVTTVSAVGGHPTAIAAEPGKPVGGAVAVPDRATILLGGASLVRSLVVGNGLEGPADQLPQLTDPLGLAAAPGGWYAVDGRHGAVFTIRAGRTEVLAGRATRKRPIFASQDGDGEHALLGLLGGIAADGRGHVYVSDLTSNCIRRITLPSGMSDARSGNGSAG